MLTLISVCVHLTLWLQIPKLGHSKLWRVCPWLDVAAMGKALRPAQVLCADRHKRRLGEPPPHSAPSSWAQLEEMEKSDWPFLSSLFTPTTSVKFFLLYIIFITLHPHLGLSPHLRLCSPLTKEHFESVWKVPDSEGVHRNKLRMNYPLTHCDTRILVSVSPSPQNPGGQICSSWAENSGRNLSPALSWAGRGRHCANL